MTLVGRLINEHPWISLLLVLVALFGFQLLNIVYGFDLWDTGFHLVAYENIIDSPDSISYNLMYYLTNVVGGAFLKLYPQMSILDFRILGAIFVLLTIICIFIALKNEIPTVHLLIGAILVVVSYVKLPYSFNNAILSCCLYAISVVILYKGLSLNNYLLVIVGGIFVGVNIFTRIPNVLAIGMVFIVLLYKKYYLKINVVDWKNACFFLLGVGGGILIILTLMTQLHHTEPFCRSLKIVFTMASGNETHNILWMLKIYIVFYLMAVIPLLVFYALFNINKKIVDCPLLIINIIRVICLLSFGLYVYYTPVPYMLLWGMFVLGCLLCIVKQRNHLGVYAILALFMLIIEIYGSDSYVNHGSLPALLAAPIASMQLFDRKKIVYVLAFVFAVFVQLIITGNYQDSGPIYYKTGLINSVEAKGIYTTDIKASVVNSTLMGIKPYVHVSDTMICFPSSPMMNYLTHTKPAGGMCWPGDKGVFIVPIEGTPIILFNKTSFLNEECTKTYNLDDKYGFDIKSFIIENEYQKVYENDYYMLFVPPLS